jgi:hypothetical protein
MFNGTFDRRDRKAQTALETVVRGGFSKKR